MDDAALAALARSSITASLAPEALRKTLLEDIEDWLKAPASA